MRQFMMTVLVWGIFITPLFSFQPLLVTQHFKGGALELGWLSSAFGLGMVSGGLVLSAWKGAKRHLTTSIAGALVISFGRLLVGAAPADAMQGRFFAVR